MNRAEGPQLSAESEIFTKPAARIDDAGVVGVVAILVEADGRRLSRLDDLGGGTFDAAGGFDRLLGRPDVHPGVLGGVDLYGVTTFERADMEGLIADIDRLTAHETLEPVESLGMQRLRVMALECARRGGLQNVFTND